MQRLSRGAGEGEILDAAARAAVAGVGARGAAIRLGAAAPGDAERTVAAAGEEVTAGAASISIPLGVETLRLDVLLREPPVPPILKPERRFLESVAAAAGAAAGAAARAAGAREEERGRLAREIHDGPAQGVGASKLELERLAIGDRALAAALEPALARLQAVFADLRALSRALRPPALDALGLEEALRRLAEDLGRRDDARAGLVRSGRTAALRPEVEGHLYRIAEEAIANVARHARAKRATIELEFLAAGGVRLAIEDDGRGFEPDGPGRGSGLGLRTIRERARTLGARLAIGAARGGGGTRVEIVIERGAGTGTGAVAGTGGPPA